MGKMAGARQSPIDGGYSYVIMVAVFFAHVLQYGFTWTVGVWYTVFKEEFQMDSKYVALISSLNTASFYAAGPISSFLTNTLGARLVCILGALIATVGMVGSMFANSVFMLYLTFGIITGFGLGVSYIPGVTMVGYYFEKRRSLAMGIAVSGCGIGTFLFPPLINYLINAFSLSGALLIIGGINLNLILIAAFYRPWTGERDMDIVIEEEEDEEEDGKKDQEVLVSDTKLNVFASKPYLNMGSRPSLNYSRPSLLVSKMSLKGSNATLNSLAVRRRLQTNFCRTVSVCDLQPGAFTGSKHSMNLSQNFIKGSRSVLGSRSMLNGSIFGDQQQYAPMPDKDPERVSTVSTTESVKSWIEKFNIDVFRNINYVILAINNLLFCFGLSIVYVHLGSYVKDTLQLSSEQSGHFFSAIGIANFIGRFAFGAICQVPFFKPMCVYTVAFFTTGLVTELCPLMDDYTWLMTYAVVFGFLSGSFGALLPSVIIQVTELDKLGSAYGYLLIFEAVGTLFGPPLAGMLFDVTGVYKNSFYLGGVFMMASALIMIYPLLHARTERQIEDELSVHLQEHLQYGAENLQHGDDEATEQNTCFPVVDITIQEEKEEKPVSTDDVTNAA